MHKLMYVWRALSVPLTTTLLIQLPSTLFPLTTSLYPLNPCPLTLLPLNPSPLTLHLNIDTQRLLDMLSVSWGQSKVLEGTFADYIKAQRHPTVCTFIFKYV
jgi:hypothetical protein